MKGKTNGILGAVVMMRNSGYFKWELDLLRMYLEALHQANGCKVA